MQFSEDGKYVAVTTQEAVVVFGLCEGGVKEVMRYDSTDVVHVAFSPQNTFLLLLRRWRKELQQPNVLVVDLLSAELLHSFVQKASFWFVTLPLCCVLYCMLCVCVILHVYIVILHVCCVLICFIVLLIYFLYLLLGHHFVGRRMSLYHLRWSALKFSSLLEKNGSVYSNSIK